jgi:predicted DNA-binding transcriptional regulator AlpA
MDKIDDCKMYTLKEVHVMLDRHPNTILNWVDDNSFPVPIKKGEKVYYWFGWQLREWIYQQPPTMSHK